MTIRTDGFTIVQCPSCEKTISLFTSVPSSGGSKSDAQFQVGESLHEGKANRTQRRKGPTQGRRHSFAFPILKG